MTQRPLKSSLSGIILLSLILVWSVPASAHSSSRWITPGINTNPLRSTNLSVSEAWTIPENISRSGAASQPYIAAGIGGILQVFWLDRIDGMVSSIYDGVKWSIPQKSSIPDGPSQMPYLVTDHLGQVHAFWQVASRSTGSEPDNGSSVVHNSLFHSQIMVGSSEWSKPVILAEDALVYSVFAPVGGGLNLAYIRQVNTEAEPAGVYVSQLLPGIDEWQKSESVYNSVYYRLLSPGNTAITIADDSAGQKVVIWKDPYQNLWLYSTQAGKNPSQSWSKPASFGDSRIQPSLVRLTAMPGTMISVWQTVDLNRCMLYQQDWLENEAGPTPTVLATPIATRDLPAGVSAATPTPDAAEWSAAEQIFPNLNSCPVGDRFWPDPQAKQIFWLWGEGTSSLSVSTWDTGTQQWSIPLSEGFSFENPEVTPNQPVGSAGSSSGVIVLNDLSATFSDSTESGAEHIAVAGNANGEIWVTRSKEAVTDFIYAPPPVWSPAQPITNLEQGVNEVSLVMDGSGLVHLVFTQPSAEGSLGASMIYTQWSGSNSTADSGTSTANLLSDQVILFPGTPNELIRQPELLVDESSKLLYLVWSGGDQSDILYTRVALNKASVPSEWFPPLALTNEGMAVDPQIGITRNGRLVVLYAIQVNERRGIYMTQSGDRGQSWTAPEQVFDAVEGGLQALDHLTMTISPDGVIHAAWTETSPAGNGVPRGIYYMASADDGTTWSKPKIVVGLGNDWPKLISAGGQLHLIYAQLTPDGGLLWHRSEPLGLPETTSSQTVINENSSTIPNNWGPAVRVPGWDEVSLPYGVAATGALTEGSLYLVGVSPVNGSFFYNMWKDGNWETSETFFPLSGSGIGIGLQAATMPEGENLTVAWERVPDQSILPIGSSSLLNNDTKAPISSSPASLYYTMRRIEAVNITVLPTVAPTLTPTVAPSPTPTTFIPTPTPDLNKIPPPNNSQQFPLIIGVVLSALIIIGIFTLNVTMKRRR